jgi:hypothetical protein
MCIMLIDGKAKSKEADHGRGACAGQASVKAMAVRMAQEDKCSMAEWLERLIEAEAARLGRKKVRGGRRVGKGAPSRRAHH